MSKGRVPIQRTYNLNVAIKNVEQLLKNTDALSHDELLEFAQLLIAKARATGRPQVDVNTLAGTLTLTEDPLAIQERMRREWE